ncbi:MAG: hypothetical protein KF845_02955 [Cyclobacteriaceae bacterium]|nr:hypothetical protein [Cyclobacteriaceae bacterium]
MENLENIILSLCMFGSAVLVIYILARYNYLLKKALAEKGIAPTKIKISYSEIACVVIGIAAGIGASSIFTVMNLSEDTTDLLVWSVILIGGGLGLFGAHFIRQKQEREG